MRGARNSLLAFEEERGVRISGGGFGASHASQIIKTILYIRIVEYSITLQEYCDNRK